VGISALLALGVAAELQLQVQAPGAEENISSKTADN